MIEGEAVAGTREWDGDKKETEDKRQITLLEQGEIIEMK